MIDEGGPGVSPGSPSFCRDLFSRAAPVSTTEHAPHEH